MKYSLFRKFLLGALAALAALTAVVVARTGGNDHHLTTATPEAGSPSTAGFVAAKDPVTGALRAPTAEEMAALQSPADVRRASREPALKSERLANGAVVTTLDRSYDVYSVATKDANGKIQQACVPADKLDATLEAAQGGELTTKEVGDEK